MKQRISENNIEALARQWFLQNVRIGDWAKTIGIAEPLTEASIKLLVKFWQHIEFLDSAVLPLDETHSAQPEQPSLNSVYSSRLERCIEISKEVAKTHSTCGRQCLATSVALAVLDEFTTAERNRWAEGVYAGHTV